MPLAGTAPCRSRGTPTRPIFPGGAPISHAKRGKGPTEMSMPETPITRRRNSRGFCGNDPEETMPDSAQSHRQHDHHDAPGDVTGNAPTLHHPHADKYDYSAHDDPAHHLKDEHLSYLCPVSIIFEADCYALAKRRKAMPSSHQTVIFRSVLPATAASSRSSPAWTGRPPPVCIEIPPDQRSGPPPVNGSSCHAVNGGLPQPALRCRERRAIDINE